MVRAVVLDGRLLEEPEDFVGPADVGRARAAGPVQQFGYLQQKQTAQVADDAPAVGDPRNKPSGEECGGAAQRGEAVGVGVEDRRAESVGQAGQPGVHRLAVGQRVEVVGVDAHDLEAEVAAAVAECGAPARREDQQIARTERAAPLGVRCGGCAV